MNTIQNSKCRDFVDDCKEFKGSNLTGVKVNESLYVVYSYGHWPIYAKIKGQWYGHNQKYSVSTSKHQSQARPSCCNIHMLDNVEQLRANMKSALR